MIRSFASKETERFYTSGQSRRIPPDIDKRAAMRLTQLSAATTSMICVCRCRTGYRPWHTTVAGSGVFVSTINGGFAFVSKMAMPLMLKSLTITDRRLL